jgi:hypothetical protein
MPEQIQIGHDPQGRPVYAEVLSKAEIQERLAETPEWASFCEKFDMNLPSNITLLNAIFAERMNEDSDLNDYVRLLKLVLAAGGVAVVDGTSYEFEFVPVSEPEPEVPTDRNGRPLSEAQIRWSEYREFSESHSMKECRERARTDAGFNSFMNKNLQREMAEPGVPDAVENLNARPQVAKQITPELQAWVEEYHRTPISRVKQLRLASFNPLGYKQYDEHFQAASAAGLI